MKTLIAWYSCKENMNKSHRISLFVSCRYLGRLGHFWGGHGNLMATQNYAAANPGWALLTRKDLCTMRDGGSGEQTEHESAVCSSSSTGQWHRAGSARLHPAKWAKGCRLLFWHAVRSSVHLHVSLCEKDTDTLEQGEWEAAAWAGDLHMLCSRSRWMYSGKWVSEKPEGGSYCCLPLLLGEWNWNLRDIHWWNKGKGCNCRHIWSLVSLWK